MGSQTFLKYFNHPPEKPAQTKTNMVNDKDQPGEVETTTTEETTTESTTTVETPVNPENDGA